MGPFIGKDGGREVFPADLPETKRGLNFFGAVPGPQTPGTAPSRAKSVDKPCTLG